MNKIFSLVAALSISAFAATVIDNPSSDTIVVNVSNQSVNRIVLPSKILDVAYSKEKGVDIKVTENQAFIKFVPIQKEQIEQIANEKMEPIGEPEIVYDKAKPSEVFFVTEGKTYAFSLNPLAAEAQTVIVNDFTKSAEEIVRYETESDHVSNMAKISQSILSGGTPQGYQYKEMDEDVKTSSKLVSLKKKGEYRGVIYDAVLFEVASKSAKPEKLSPKSFIKLASAPPKSITIYYGNEVNNLLPYGKAMVVIVTKGKENERK